MTDDEASLPALRTGGFVVTRDDRARQLVGQIDTNAAHEDDHTADTARRPVRRGRHPRLPARRRGRPVRPVAHR